MKSDPISPQGRQTVTIGELAFTFETPPDLDALLDHAATVAPNDVDAIPYYSILWPAAHGLAHYLWKNRSGLTGCRVLELGCGLGLPSVLAARLGATVTATDFHPDTGRWVLHNAALNQVTLNYSPLDWNAFLTQQPQSKDQRGAQPEAHTPLADLRPPASGFSLVIGSDLLYERRHIPALICTIGALCAADGQAVIADPGRDNLQLFVSGMEQDGWRHTLIPVGDIYVCRFERT